MEIRETNYYRKHQKFPGYNRFLRETKIETMDLSDYHFNPKLVRLH